jgi:hypothetical protein
LSGVAQVQRTVSDEEAAEMAQRVYSWEEWANIVDETGVRRAADIARAVLRGVADPAR